jgi:hypothetical protein
MHKTTQKMRSSTKAIQGGVMREESGEVRTGVGAEASGEADKRRGTSRGLNTLTAKIISRGCDSRNL